MSNESESGERRRAKAMRFQPIVNLRTGRRVGAEAVVAAAERNAVPVVVPGGLPGGVPSGTALHHACAEAAGWSAGRVAVNVTESQLRDGIVLRQIAAALEGSGLIPERLDVELSEPLLADIDLDALLTLSVARDLGVGVVLDEFGTGAASLRMLKRLPLTGLKLDVSLVRSLPGDADDAAIVRAVVGAAHALGLVVTACGLECQAQRAALAAYGCDEGQGALFADAPHPARLRRERLRGPARGAHKTV